MTSSFADDTSLILETIGNNVRVIRESKGISVLSLSKTAHYDRSSLIALEQGKHNITYRSLLRLAKALNCSFPIVFKNDISPKYVQPFIPDNYLYIFTENIKREIQASSNTPIKLYTSTGINQASISRLLNGKNLNPFITTLSSIAGFFNHDCSSLFSRYY